MFPGGKISLTQRKPSGSKTSRFTLRSCALRGDNDCVNVSRVLLAPILEGPRVPPPLPQGRIPSGKQLRSPERYPGGTTWVVSPKAARECALDSPKPGFKRQLLGSLSSTSPTIEGLI